MADTVRYGGGDNSVLRLVLHNTWGKKCYWCGDPKEFNDIEIDHILPQDAGVKDLEGLKTAYPLDEDFDIHGVENLAPICARCQRRKGSRRYGAIGIVLDALRTASRYGSTIVKKVQKFGNSGNVAQLLLGAIKADLNDPDVRHVFEDYAPALVQKLALLDEAKADYICSRIVGPPLTPYNPLNISLALDNGGRTAVAIFEDVCGCSVEEVLRGPIAEIMAESHRKVQARLEGMRYYSSPIFFEAPYSVSTRLVVASISYAREGPLIAFTFAGEFEDDVSATAVRQGDDGIGLVEFQEDAWTSGRFSFTATFDFLAEPESLVLDACSIDWWGLE
ncbi:hypothetical protein AB0C33_20080 [Nonomuraea sp. NPDC048881]|uniref:HNH endonuclease n=1 Tax=Nonomuraea sp. NPDC048881 TaxID=3155030 RepID=UPI0033C38076